MKIFKPHRSTNFLKSRDFWLKMLYWTKDGVYLLPLETTVTSRAGEEIQWIKESNKIWKLEDSSNFRKWKAKCLHERSQEAKPCASKDLLEVFWKRKKKANYFSLQKPGRTGGTRQALMMELNLDHVDKLQLCTATSPPQQKTRGVFSRELEPKGFELGWCSSCRMGGFSWSL